MGRLCTGSSRLKLQISNPGASGKLRPCRNSRSCDMQQLFSPVKLVSVQLYLCVLKKKMEREDILVFIG